MSSLTGGLARRLVAWFGRLIERRRARKTFALLCELDQLDLAVQVCKQIHVAPMALDSLEQRRDKVTERLADRGSIMDVIRRRSRPLAIDSCGVVLRLPWGSDEVPERWWERLEDAVAGKGGRLLAEGSKEETAQECAQGEGPGA